MIRADWRTFGYVASKLGALGTVADVAGCEAKCAAHTGCMSFSWADADVAPAWGKRYGHFDIIVERFSRVLISVPPEGTKHVWGVPSIHGAAGPD